MNIKDENQMLRYLEKRIQAQERLLIAYRIGGRPPETTMKTLASTRDWEKVLAAYREMRG